MGNFNKRGYKLLYIGGLKNMKMFYSDFINIKLGNIYVLLILKIIILFEKMIFLE